MPHYYLIPLILLGILLFFSLFYLFAVRPAPTKRMGAFLGAHYAHRGLHNEERPENSLSAFRAACENGYGIELDVQLSSDGVPVVFHDEMLARVTGQVGRVRDYTAKQLSRMALCGKADQTIPTLQAVLDEVGGRVPLLVEIKCYEKAAKVCETVAPLLDAYRGPYMMESFNPYALYWFKKHRRAVLRGQLTGYLFEKGKRSFGRFVVQTMVANFLTRPNFIACHHYARRMLSFKLAVRLWGGTALAWTVKSKAKESLYLASGFSDIIFEQYLPNGKDLTP